jgi:iron complex outermembrane receptor protein
MKSHRIAAFAFLSAVATAAFAQQDIQRGEKIEVTGSSIKRIDGETALPVQILRREDIERIGATTTEELLRHVTAAASAGSLQVSQANGTVTTSQSTISLRALGGTRTLVLVNGRRVAVFGGTNSTAVDVNSIPVEAIDRIEVLKDGASSLYGSDAIAGVVNFILRRDYVGAEARAMYGAPTRSGGGKTWLVSGFAGFGDLDKNGYNLTFGAGYEKIDPILGRDRPFAHNINVGEGNDLSSTIAFPGNILFGPTFGRFASPAFPNCGPTSIVSPFFIGNVNSGSACRFENSPFLSVQSGSEKIHALLNLRYRVSSAMEAYLDSGFTRNKFSYTTQPVPISEGTTLPSANPYNAFLANLIATQYPTLAAGLRRFSTIHNTLVLLPPTSPFFPSAFVASLGLPANQPIAFRYRDFANGLRHTEDSADNIRVVAGVKGTAASWDYDSAFLFSESKAASNLQAGYPTYSRFLPILDSGAVNPFGPTTDPATLAAVQAAEFRGDIYTSKTSITSVDAKASRELLQMRSGALALAVGAEAREERFTYNPSFAFQIGDVAGFGGNTVGVDRKRHVASVYGEAAIPLSPNFEADVGVRYDNYQVVGSTTNPKLSLRFQPSTELLLRASVGSGFRAPSLTDLYNPQASSVTSNGTRDPIRCPNPAVGLPADCNNQFSTITGGNPKLKPEKSLSSTVGLLFEPMRDLSIGVDAYWIRLKDSIVPGGLNFAFILANAQNATQYSQFLVRGAPDGNASGVGPILGVVQTASNLFRVRVSGWDVDLKFRPMNNAAGKITMRLDGSYVRQFKRENADGTWSNQVDLEITAGGGVIPSWRHVASLAYETGPWVATLFQNYQKGYHDITSTFAAAGFTAPTPRRVNSYETYDAQVSFAGLRNVQLALGVKNLRDRDPPYTNGGGQFAAGYDIAYADVRGRFVYGTVTLRFR